MTAEEIVVGLIQAGEGSAAKINCPDDQVNAFLRGWLELELERALAVLIETDTPATRHHMETLTLRLSAPPTNVPRGTLIKGSEHPAEVAGEIEIFPT